MGTLTSGTAIAEAADAALRKLLQILAIEERTTLRGNRAKDLYLDGKDIVAKSSNRLSVLEALSSLEGPLQAEATTGRDMGHSKYARSAFGAQFAKVVIDPDTRHVQVERLVGAFAGGRVLNPVRSQLLGGMVWGIGQALVEESLIDSRTGSWMNGNLGEALVPVNADIADVEAILIEEDDSRGSALGVKNMGEIGVVGTAAAISNAIYHATGQRLLSLPMKVDDLLRKQ